VRQVEHFIRAFSAQVPRIFEMGRERREASEALAARQCWVGWATFQFGQAAADVMPDTSIG